MNRARSERGSALIMSMVFMLVLLGIGAALMSTAIGQKRSSFNQQSSESAYALAEAALNAQVLVLSERWPTINDAPTPGSATSYPYSCTAANAGFSYCPNASDFTSNYPTNTSQCPAGSPADAWSNSSTSSNGWTTYVRATDSSSPALFNSASEETALRYDSAFGDGSAPPVPGSVWIRAVGIVNCHIAVLVTKVSDQIIGLNFPKYVLNANSFTISDSGQKDIINTQDTGTNTSQISLRCTGDGGLPPSSTCAGVQNSSQIAPTVSYSSNPAPSPTLTNSQLLAAQQLAIANNTYFPTGRCPTDASQLAGLPVYVTGPCDIQIQSNATINSPQHPGMLIIANGTLTLLGSSTFYGVIYAVNQQNASGTIVTLGGTTTVVGGVAVDGNGRLALNLGSSGNGAVDCTDTGSTANKCGDLEFDSNAFKALDGFAGAAPTPNTFRQLPNNQ